MQFPNKTSHWDPDRSVEMCGNTSATGTKTTHLLRCHFILDLHVISLPRQARDKHKESTQKKRDAVLQAASTRLTPIRASTSTSRPSSRRCGRR